MISMQGNVVNAQGMDMHEEDNEMRNTCESDGEVVRRFLTEVGFSDDQLCE